MELEPLDFDPFPTTAATAAPKPAPTLEPIDFDPFPVAASQPEPQGWYESTAQTARDSISKSAVGRGFTAGMLKENPDNLGNAVEGFGYLSGSTWAVDQGKAIQDWAKTAGGVSKQGAGVLDSDSLDSFLTNVGETFGSGVASTVPSVVAGLGGAAVGSVAGPVGAIGGGVVGAGSASYVQSFGELYGALKEAGVDPQRAAELSKYGAVPIASLDMIGLGGMAKPFIGEARREIVHGLARRIATEAAKGATTEGITEAAQEFLKDATVTYETGRPLFTAEERKAQIREAVSGVCPPADAERVEIDSLSTLLIHYVQKRGAQCVVRGLRAIADFEFEFQLAHMNHQLAPDIETLFLMTDQQHFYVNSSLVKEVAQFGGEVSAMVPPGVATALRSRLIASATEGK